MIGVRAEQTGNNVNLFGRLTQDSMAHLDWTVDVPKSNLAVALLNLVKMCFKDLRRPDFKEDTYNLVEVIISQLLENLDSPALSKYIQEVLEICNEMIIVK